MGELREFTTGNVDVSADGRNVSGYAYRWGELTIGGTPEAGGLREGFDKGAFAEAIAARTERPYPYLNRHTSKNGRTIGGIRYSEDEVGLRYEGRLLDTPAAREYAAEAAIADSVSMEVIIDTSKSRRDKDAVIHRSARPVALAGATIGAYEGATVAIREVQKVEEIVKETVPVGAERAAEVVAGVIPLTEAQTVEIARRVAEEQFRMFAERAGTPAPSHPLQRFRGLGEMVQAAERGELSRNFVQLAMQLTEYALDDTVSTAGANAALLTGNLTVRNIAGIVSRGRPAITAFGGPAPIGDVGMSVTWPYFDGTLTDFVGAQSAQKAEITSAALDVKLGTEALVTYAGGSDVSYQLIRQSEPSVVEALSRVVLTAWGVVTDAAFVTELESGSVTSDFAEALSAVDATEFKNLLIDASIAVQTATGSPAEFALASTTAFTQFAKLLTPVTTLANTGVGTTDLQTLRVNVGGIPVIHVPSITAGKLIVSNQLAARWHEAGPFLAQNDDVPKLGRNFAWWSMGAGARYIPAGIIEMYDVTP